ncbi:MAG TPA: EamA family transporter [Marmoricola sp.]|nr:EamA family transporter [Marmoricola sp.]
MTATISQPPAALAGAPRTPRSRRFGIAMMTTGAAGNQLGAGIGAHAFDAIGPAGVVAMRQLVAASVLLPVARPPFRRMTWAQWWPALLLAGVFGCMNLALYSAIDRIGLGLAVTLEFLGPLAVALAASRGRRDLVAAAVAGAGVYALVLPGPTSDYLGLGLGLAAAACWAAYIALNRVVGVRLPGLQGPAVATTGSALAYLPVLLVLAGNDRLVGMPVVYAVAAGLLSSVVPYAADLTALRSVPPRFFGIFMSAHPVLAALAGVALLGEGLAPNQWAGIALVVAANVLAATTTGHHDRPPRG